jgi:hypothetical protein
MPKLLRWDWIWRPWIDLLDPQSFDARVSLSPLVSMVVSHSFYFLRWLIETSPEEFANTCPYSEYYFVNGISVVLIPRENFLLCWLASTSRENSVSWTFIYVRSVLVRCHILNSFDLFSTRYFYTVRACRMKVYDSIVDRHYKYAFLENSYFSSLYYRFWKARDPEGKTSSL